MTVVRKKKDGRSVFEIVEDACGKDGQEWDWPGRFLKAGDILRTPQDESRPQNGFLYSICTGGGFGCDSSKMGHAIFVRIESRHLDDVLALAADPKAELKHPFLDGARWERYWGIQVMRKPS